MVESVFLKLPSRLEALIMVMTLCLLVYNVAQYRLRLKLKEEKETLLNQLDMEVQNPTLRWIFQIMEGIGIVRFYEDEESAPIREMVTNLTTLRKKIIHLFGETAFQMYGINPKKCRQYSGNVGCKSQAAPNPLFQNLPSPSACIHLRVPEL